MGGGNVDRQKTVSDWILATQDTVFVLQTFLGQLESWRVRDKAEPEDFLDACQQLQEAGLWDWAREAGGHGLKALATALEVNGESFDLIRGG
jgi:hypothetical protein